MAECWWQFGDKKVYGLAANLTLADEGSAVAWFYAKGVNGAVSKAGAGDCSRAGAVVYVDDTGAFDVGIPLSVL